MNRSRIFGALAFICIAVAPADAAVTATEMVSMQDGVKLATDVYLPAQGGPWPVLLARTPYDKDRMAQTGLDIQNSKLAAAVIQDLRGRFHSEGTDCIFSCDADDGAETIAWIMAQPWCNGKIMTHGGSALGIVQYMLAPKDPDGLVGMIVDVATPDLYDFMFPGGVFRQNDVEGWLASQGSTFWLDNIKEHPFLDSHWEPVTGSKKFGEVNVPVLHAGGWFDIFTQGTIDAFVGYQTKGGAGARGKQKMVIGPWSHGARGKEQGDLVFPDNATQDAIKLGDTTLTWMLHYLDIQNRQAQIDAIPAVQYYTMGAVGEPGAPGNEWRSAGEWPVPAAPTRYYLHEGGRLSSECPEVPRFSAIYSYDPAKPTPTLGGANLTLVAGPYDQRPIEKRDDVLVFSTNVLSAPVEITGRVKAHLWVGADTPDTDLMVRLTDVYPDGRSMLVTDGSLRLATRGRKDGVELLELGEVFEAVVDVGSTSMIFNAGHRIRIIVSSSNAPRFYPNPNNGEYYGTSTPAQASHVLLFYDKVNLSYLEAPNPNLSPEHVYLCESETCPLPDGGSYSWCTSNGPSYGHPCDEEGTVCQMYPCPELGPDRFGVDCVCQNCRWACAVDECWRGPDTGYDTGPDGVTPSDGSESDDGDTGNPAIGGAAKGTVDGTGCSCASVGH